MHKTHLILTSFGTNGGNAVELSRTVTHPTRLQNGADDDAYTTRFVWDSPSHTYKLICFLRQEEVGEQGAGSRGGTSYMNVESSAQKGGLPHEQLHQERNY
ncbi:hypothetical protein [Calothrix rhizosoleniae]|uniref:hypothetical protein n=1 Tax=Calothrix rhizosoleniae TaxID=888997 RepID=UPI000B4A0E82|nr:hypothetical protein [Calothrix rhizosoleniae]